MGNPVTFLKSVFVHDALIRALPVLTLIAGLAGFAITYLVIPAETQPVLFDASRMLSQTVLTGGLVSALLNSFKYMGIFRGAVQDVVFGTDHLKTRNDLPALWSRITSIICQEKFPQLADRLQSHVLAHFVPAGKDFYYSEYSRECIIRVDGDDRDVVTIREELDLRVHPADPATEIAYAYHSHTDSRTPRDLARVALNLLSVDGVVQQVGLVEEDYDDEFGGKGLHQSYVIPLKGQASYRIRRSMTRRLCITTDPVLEFSSKEFILGCTVRFKSEDPALVPVFQSVGTEEFDDRGMGRDGNWDVHREFGGLMFPRQGYILFIQRRYDAVAAPDASVAAPP